MNVVCLAAGAAGTFCGACARDVTLVRKLIARGHDVLMLPLYTPLAVDGPDPSHPRVFYGGINAFLEQKFRFFRRPHPLLDRLLAAPWLLRAVSRFAVRTRPENLGEMTVSVLQGADGRQAKELDALIAFLQSQARPDVLNLTNSLLASIAPEAKRRLGVPVVCFLQGEESFINRLPEPHAARAVDLMRRHARSIDLFIAPHAAYADEMAELLDVPADRFRVVRPGVDLADYPPPAEPPPDEPFRIGCLSRLSPDKGTDVLCRAFAEVRRRRPGSATLTLAGQLGPNQRRWWRHVQRDLHPDARRHVDYRGAVDHAGKLAMLHGLSVFVQPSRFPERRGMAALEALAVGVPVVVPRSGIFPEMIRLTGGGLLTEPGDVESVVTALCQLIDHPDQRQRLSEAARDGVHRHYSADVMADDTLAAWADLCRGAEE